MPKPRADSAPLREAERGSRLCPVARSGAEEASAEMGQA